ncbi:hypothetical protein Cni_G03152 [Canna indica]|uniref:Uncharacterized protein n=1 Tax=Canna indica TaxID=4628 RepID=A0AAQ3Q2T8_9LILI|nr:hypothetical protein Cni_G03152 [Canna indica]
MTVVKRKAETQRNKDRYPGRVPAILETAMKTSENIDEIDLLYKFRINIEVIGARIADGHLNGIRIREVKTDRKMGRWEGEVDSDTYPMSERRRENSRAPTCRLKMGRGGERKDRYEQERSQSRLNLRARMEASLARTLSITSNKQLYRWHITNSS